MRSRYSVLSPQNVLLLAICQALTNGFDLLVRELCMWMRLAFNGDVLFSSLGNHIVCIVCTSAKKEVSRIDTGGIVARVANKDVRRDGSIVKSPAIAMGKHGFPVYLKRTVAVFVLPPSPYPTLNALLDAREKPIFGGRVDNFEVMEGEKLEGLTFHPSFYFVGLACRLSLLSASAMAKSVVRHVVNSFQVWTLPLVSYRCNYTTIIRNYANVRIASRALQSAPPMI